MIKIKTYEEIQTKFKDREFRKFDIEIRAADDGMFVEGYAATFDSPTVLWEYDGIEYKEQIDSKAFDESDLSDVIFNYNHGGKVMARTRNKTLEIKTDKKGLGIKAKLDGTEEGRKLYEEIKGGYIDRMSFAFSVSESSYDSDKRLRTIKKVKKVYDVSAVDIPAYEDTSISARSFFEVATEKEKLANETQRKAKILRLALMAEGIE